MPSSWNVYYVIFLSAALALGIPATLALISFIVSPRSVKEIMKSPALPALSALNDVSRSNETFFGQRTNTRFFLGVNSALILIALVLVLIPCVGMFKPESGSSIFLRALIAIVSICAFAALGLFYSVRKGDLSWLRVHQKPSVPGKEKGAL